MNKKLHSSRDKQGSENIKTVSILGCGWLGFPLGKLLVQRGFIVRGSTTDQNKLKQLQSSRIQPYLIDINSLEKDYDLSGFLDSKYLFLNIPFKRSLTDPDFYKEQIKIIVSAVLPSSVKVVIFASSTSVYPSSLRGAKEGVSFESENQRAKVLLETERLLQENTHFETTIIRFAGLYGGDRKIGQFLSGRTIDNPDSPVNLIHLEDCVEIVTQIIEHNITGEIFNACSDGHPTRKELYSKTAIELGVKEPHFIGQTTQYKVVDNSKIKEHLSYNFRYPFPQ